MQHIKYIIAVLVLAVMAGMGIKISSLETKLSEVETIATEAGINATQPTPNNKLIESLIVTLGQGGILTQSGDNIIVNPVISSALAPQIPQELQ